jgi:hypothetical protein
MDDKELVFRDCSTIAITWKDVETTKFYNVALANVY